MGLGGIRDYYAWVNSYDWKIDNNNGVTLRYPKQEFVVNPGGAIHYGSFTDTPGLDASWLFGSGRFPDGSQIKLLKQDFEVHIVCLIGLERGAVYGGVRWGDEFEWYNGNYHFSSYASQMTEPSQEWMDLWKECAPRWQGT